jgi:hypothetical protein
MIVYAKLKDQIDGENWNPLNEEEYEDSEGNVLTRKVSFNSLYIYIFPSLTLGIIIIVDI